MEQTRIIHLWPRSHKIFTPENETLCGIPKNHVSIGCIVYYLASFYGSLLTKCQDCLYHPEVQMQLLAKTEL